MEQESNSSRRERSVLALRRGTLPIGSEERLDWVWRNHLYSQIRNCSPSGNHGARAPSPPSHVASRDVFHQHRRGYRQWGGRWRNHGNGSWLVLLMVLLLAWVAGCGRHHPNKLQQLYAEARQKADLANETRDANGLSAALRLAEEGFSSSAADPLLNYKFRLLRAELIAPTEPA